MTAQARSCPHEAPRDWQAQPRSPRFDITDEDRHGMKLPIQMSEGNEICVCSDLVYIVNETTTGDGKAKIIHTREFQQVRM